MANHLLFHWLDVQCHLMVTIQLYMNLQVHSKDVYMPGLHVGLFAPDKRAYFCMYDRVINVRPDITVPLGLKGTLIGIHR